MGSTSANSKYPVCGVCGVCVVCVCDVCSEWYVVVCVCDVCVSELIDVLMCWLGWVTSSLVARSLESRGLGTRLGETGRKKWWNFNLLSFDDSEVL